MRVLLVSMPFGGLDGPALGISTLKARLRDEGVSCDAAYLSLAFASILGHEQYQAIIDDVPFSSLACEWVFAACLFGSSIPPQEAYISNELRGRWRLEPELIQETVVRARDLASRFLERCLRSVDFGEYDVVGFTTVGQQNIASLALAQAIKASHPHCAIVFGGHSWEGPMGRALLRRFPFVDFAFSGYADESFPAFVRQLAVGSVAAGRLSGLTYRHNGETKTTPESRTASALPQGPLPDFADYFASRQQDPEVSEGRPLIPVEASRGCWWATRGACRFCGISGSKSVYRSKSSDAVLRELRSRAADWPGAQIDIVDSVVSSAFLEEVLPELAARPLDALLSFSIRPDVRREHVRDAGAAGAELHCGIESLSDRVLGLIRKGTRTTQNVRLLKWCREYGVNLSWNMLYAVPGEVAEDYRQVTSIMPAVQSFQPPAACAPVDLERFSHYLEHSADLGLRHPRPASPYSYIYPFDSRTLWEIAYFFDYAHPSEADRPAYIHRLRAQVSRWQRDRDLGALTFVDRENELRISDTRKAGSVGSTTLRGADRRLYLACEDIGRFRSLCLLARSDPDESLQASTVRTRLDTFVARGWMLADRDSYLSLAVRQLPPDTCLDDVSAVRD